MKCPKCRGYSYIEYDTFGRFYYETCLNCGYKDYDKTKEDYNEQKVETIVVKETK